MSNQPSWSTAGRFLLGSSASYALVIGVTAGLHEIAGVAPPTAYAVALVVALIFNFLVNRHLVFRKGTGNQRTQAFRFVLTSCTFRAAEWLAFAFLANTTTTHYTVLATIVQAVSLLLKYVAFRRFVFR